MSDNNSPFAWLGLLKWSLAYSDGTRPADDTIEPMSKEDKEFLEKVMKEGIIDEGERMKTILKDLTDGLESMLKGGGTDGGSEEEKRKELSEDDMLDLFQELRDIVEQIDYARAFMAMGGIPFLLGCATTEGNVPKSIRKAALSVMATMCQNNPPVQLNLLEVGHIPHFIQLFFDYTPTEENGYVGDDSIREKVVQALSASIRGHSMAEHVFCKNEQGRLMLQIGIGMTQEEGKTEQQPKPSAQLRRRCMFLLRALLTADDTTNERWEQYKNVIAYICTHETNPAWEDDAEIREISIAMLTQLLKQKPSPTEDGGTADEISVASTTIAQHKNDIAAIGIKRIKEIQIEGQVSVQALICLYNHHKGHSSNENEHEYQSSEYDDARPS
eukprot:scaffold2420_cov208-Alexandrium_tamarense.AAC.7